MAFLSFMKNKPAGQQPSAEKAQQRTPETAKQMFTREAAQEKANRKPVEQTMRPDQIAEVKEVGARLDKATQHLNQAAQAPSSRPAEGAANPQPMRQNMMNQDKTTPALSPTTAQAGAPATQKNSPTLSQDAPAKTPEAARPAPARAHTPPAGGRGGPAR